MAAHNHANRKSQLSKLCCDYPSWLAYYIKLPVTQEWHICISTSNKKGRSLRSFPWYDADEHGYLNHFDMYNCRASAMLDKFSSILQM